MPTEFGQQNNTTEILAKLGLNPLEQKMYLYGISIAPLTVSSLAKHIGTTRPNAYNVIKALQEKGLCWNLGSEYGRRIKFAEPEMLLELYESKLNDLKGVEVEIKRLSKDLKKDSYAGPAIQPRVQYFEGKESVRKLYRDSLLTKEKLIRSAVYKGVYETLGREYVDEYIRDRYQRKIKNKILYAHNLEVFDKNFEPDPTKSREVRIPPDTVNFDSMILIYDAKVVFITMTNEIFGTMIESIDFSNTMKSWFDTIWKVSGER